VDTGTTIGLAIALGTLLVTLWLGLSRLRHERTLADLQDARSILAEGAAELKGINDSLDQLYQQLTPIIVFREAKPQMAVGALLEEARRPFGEAEAIQAELR
jgi:hypothetical protein